MSHDGRIFLRGSVLNEDRHNGTPIQINSTRLWRYAGGADWSNLVVRLFGDNEHYSQTFSTINATRTGETLTRIGKDPADELGAAGHWHQPVGTRLLLLAGADIHDVRAADYETLFPTSKGYLNTTARQRQSGVYGEVLFTPPAWTLSASGRVDHFSNFDASQYKTATAPAKLPQLNETVFDPRIGITRRLTKAVALSASAFRAYRAPTENELYRTGQVGQQTTQPNPNLRSERATGWETGVHTDLPAIGSTVRVSYFWTQINRPITALTLSTTPTSSLLKRENLGQIESRGVSLDYASRPVSWMGIEGGYQYADATVTSNAQQPNLVGNWIPQVARNMATAQVAFSHRRLGLPQPAGTLQRTPVRRRCQSISAAQLFPPGRLRFARLWPPPGSLCRRRQSLRSIDRSGQDTHPHLGVAARRPLRCANQFRRVSPVQLRSLELPSPEGTLKVAQDAVLGLLREIRVVPKGRLNSSQFSAVPRDYPMWLSLPRTASWATFRRPFRDSTTIRIYLCAT